MSGVVVARLRKALEFLRSNHHWSVEVHPFPHSEPGYPYFLVLPLNNYDGYGGYSRNYRFDEHGVPFRPRDQTRLYLPLVVARYGLKMLAIHRETGAEIAVRRAVAVVPALVRSSQYSGFWTAGSSPWSMHGSTGHANVQGTVLSFLVRVLRLFPEEVDGVEVRAAIDRGFRRLVGRFPSDGCASLIDGLPFLEEFPRQPPSHALESCITGLLGLYDLADGLEHRVAAQHAREVERCIERLLPRFRTRVGWSVYALNVCGIRLVSSMHYHRTLISLMEILAARTGSEQFARTARFWRNTLESPVSRLVSAVEKTAQAFWLRYVRRADLAEG